MNKGKIKLFEDADTSYITRKQLDIPYNFESDFQKLDIYYPEEGKGLFPAVIWVHGGAWARCDKKDTQIVPFLKILDDGYALISINYRLTQDGPFPLGYNDVLDAYKYIFDHAQELNLNPDRIGVAGESAGANYVLLSLKERFPFKCVLSWYGATDIPKLNEQKKANGTPYDSNDKSDSLEARYLGCPISEASEELIVATSPIYQIQADYPPIFLEHGLKDVKVPYQQSETYYEKAKEIMGDEKLRYITFQEAGHGDPKIKADENMKTVRTFFKEYI